MKNSIIGMNVSNLQIKRHELMLANTMNIRNKK